MKPFKHTGLFLVLAAVSTTASATAITYNLTSPTSTTELAGGVSGDSYKGSYTYDKAVDLTVTGWSNVSTTDHRIKQDEVGLWSGLGVENSNTPNHAVDNASGDYDMLLLSFSDMMKLSFVTNAWNNNGSYDSDISILAFTGSSFSSSSLLNKTWDSLLTTGWSVAGNYKNLAENVSTSVNGSGIYSQYWLVGAYNPAFSKTSNDTTADYFKLGAVTAETQSSSKSSSSVASSVKSTSSTASSVASSTPKSSASSVKSSVASSTATSSDCSKSSSSVSSAASSVKSSVASSTPSSVASSAASSGASSIPSSASSSLSSIYVPPPPPGDEPPPPVTKVPEPSGWLLVLIGLLGLGLSRRTKK